MSKLKTSLFVLTIYSVIAVLFTYPLVTNFNRYILGYPGDSLVNIWFYWWVKNYRPDILVLHTYLQNFPFGLSIGNIFFGPLISTFFPLLISLVTNEIFAYNIYIFISFILAPFFTFLICLKLTKSVPGSFVAGLVFGFSQYHLWQSLNHPDLASIQYLPVFFYFCLVYLENIEKRLFSKKLLVLLVLSFALVLHTSFYYAYFSVIVYGFLSVIYLLQTKFRALYLYIFPVILFIIPALPMVINLFNLSLQSGHVAFPSYVPKRNISDLIAYGSRPWDYILPSIYHPVFGQSVRDFYGFLRTNLSYQYWSPYLPERVNFLGYTALVLSSIAVVKNLKGNVDKIIDRKQIMVVGTLALFMFLLSLPAEITIKGFTFYMPSFIFFKFFPFIRVYSRAGVFVLLCLSILSGYGFKYLVSMALGNAKFFRFSRLLVIIITILIIFENVNYPSNFFMDTYKVPKTYQWIKNIPGDFAIVDYPKDNSLVDLDGGCPAWLNGNVVRDYNEAYSVFYQREHGKRLFGYKTLSKAERVLLGDLSKQDAYNVLKKYNVSYVLIHSQDPMVQGAENPLDECWRRRVMKIPETLYKGFKKVAEFDDGEVLKIN